MPITVKYPNGSLYDFPDGTPKETIDAHYNGLFGGQQQPQPAGVVSGLARGVMSMIHPSQGGQQAAANPQPTPTMPDLAGTNFAFAAPGTVEHVAESQQQSNQSMIAQRAAEAERIRIQTEHEKDLQQQIKLQQIQFQNQEKLAKLAKDRQDSANAARVEAAKTKAAADHNKLKTVGKNLYDPENDRWITPPGQEGGGIDGKYVHLDVQHGTDPDGTPYTITTAIDKRTGMPIYPPNKVRHEDVAKKPPTDQYGQQMAPINDYVQTRPDQGPPTPGNEPNWPPKPGLVEEKRLAPMREIKDYNTFKTKSDEFVNAQIRQAQQNAAAAGKSKDLKIDDVAKQARISFLRAHKANLPDQEIATWPKVLVENKWYHEAPFLSEDGTMKFLVPVDTVDSLE